MIIINAEFPAGLTIEEAIGEAIDFCEKNNCMIKTELNDIPMTICNLSTFDSRTKLINYYFKIFEREVNLKYDRKS